MTTEITLIKSCTTYEGGAGMEVGSRAACRGSSRKAVRSKHPQEPVWVCFQISWFSWSYELNLACMTCHNYHNKERRTKMLKIPTDKCTLVGKWHLNHNVMARSFMVTELQKLVRKSAGFELFCFSILTQLLHNYRTIFGRFYVHSWVQPYECFPTQTVWEYLPVSPYFGLND